MVYTFATWWPHGLTSAVPLATHPSPALLDSEARVSSFEVKSLLPAYAMPFWKPLLTG